MTSGTPGDRARSVLAQSRYDPQRWARERRTRNVLPTAVIVSSTVRKNDTLRARGRCGTTRREGLGDKPVASSVPAPPPSAIVIVKALYGSNRRTSRAGNRARCEVSAGTDTDR